MDRLFYYNQGREVPDTAKKPIQGGRMSGKTDINPMWRIKKLTEMFGPCGVGWYYRSVNEWMEAYEKEVAAFVKIELYVKVDGEWSMPIQGTGGSMFVEVQKSGAHVSDECYKMATTDAISVACKQLGIGADVYWDRDQSKYSTGQSQQPQARNADEETRKLRAELSSLLERAGFSPEAVCRKYNAESIENISKLQLKDCIMKLKDHLGKAVPR